MFDQNKGQTISVFCLYPGIIGPFDQLISF